MSDKEKNENQIYFIGCFFTVLIVFNFLIVNSFADGCSITDQACSDGLHPWYVFFMRFQTFITGILAIVAALITVWQMRKSDERADKRHRSQLRAQSRIVDRSLHTLKFTHARTLNGHLKHIKDKVAEIEESLDDWENSYQSWIGKSYSEMYRIFGPLNANLSHKSWEEHKAGLSPVAQSAYYHLSTKVNIFRESRAHPTEYRGLKSKNAKRELEVWLKVLKDIEGKLFTLIFEIGD